MVYPSLCFLVVNPYIQKEDDILNMEQKNKLYVGNLPFAVDDNQLKEIFSKFGEVVEAIVIKNKFNGRSKGFGFVTLKDEAAAEAASKEMNQAEVMGRKLVVNIARPKKEDNERTNFTPAPKTED